MMREAVVRIGTSVFFIVLFGYGVYEMAQVRPLAGGFPLVMSAVGLAASLLTLVVEATKVGKLRRQRVMATGEEDGSPAPVEQRSSEGVMVSEELRYVGPAAYYFLWAVGFAGLVWLFGALVGSYLFLLAFFVLEAKTRRLFTVVGPIVAVLFLWLIETVLEPIRWPEGLVQIL
jgi:hypothetical protein